MDSPEIQPQQQVEPRNMEQAEIAAKYGLAKWIFARGRDFVKGRILEIGEGEGRLAKYCKREGMTVDVLPVDLKNGSFNEAYKDLLEVFDVVYILHNGQELLNDKLIVNNSTRLLKQGGYLIALLPCKIALYEGLDQGLEDWSAKNRKNIRTRVGTYYDVIKTRYFAVMETLPSLMPPKSEYEEWVKLFQKTTANSFLSKGLFTLIIGQKK